MLLPSEQKDAGEMPATVYLAMPSGIVKRVGFSSVEHYLELILGCGRNGRSVGDHRR